MSKTPLPFHVGDISHFAQALRHRIETLDRPPSHVEMLNLLVKAGGYRNFQHFRARHDSFQRLMPLKQTPAEVDAKRIKKLARHFDAAGRLTRWPKQFTLRLLCLWVLWSHLPAKRTFTEPEINALLGEWHLFEDPALLRRELADRGFVERAADGSRYTRRERRPPAEAIEALRQLRP